MHQFIDRRQNPKGKSLGNRQRFIRRARAQIKEVVNKSVRDRSITDVASGETVTIPTKGIGEPRFNHSSKGGIRERVFAGNKEFETGDRIPKPQQGEGGGGKKATDQGDGEDEFQFALSREEFLDLFFEDLELPNLVKTTLKEIVSFTRHRAGFSRVGNPSNLDVSRTMRNSLGRRIALARPKNATLEDLRRQIVALEAKTGRTDEDEQKLRALIEELDVLERRRKVVGFIDPFDVRYRYNEQRPEPNTNAVMFCLMDVSGSMGQREKDLAKRFFVLLHMFLKRRYEHVDVVFIRHTHEASEVDEETFFYSPQTGGTVVSTALREMAAVVADRYPTDTWNIYAAQASDGENFSGDSERCVALLHQELMPVCQYFTYVEIIDEREMGLFGDSESGAALWQAYRTVKEQWQNFEMKRIAKPGDIYPAFRELFAKQVEQA